jgi:hypothetical protein
MVDLEPYYVIENDKHVLFGDLPMTKKGCETMIKVVKETDLEKFKKDGFKSEMKHYFNGDGTIKDGKLKNLAIKIFEKYVYLEDYTKFCSQNVYEEKDYKEQCREFLRLTGYFLEEDIIKFTRLSGRFMMGGQYTIRNSIIDILYQKETL